MLIRKCCAESQIVHINTVDIAWLSSANVRNFELSSTIRNIPQTGNVGFPFSAVLTFDQRLDAGCWWIQLTLNGKRKRRKVRQKLTQLIWLFTSRINAASPVSERVIWVTFRFLKKKKLPRKAIGELQSCRQTLSRVKSTGWADSFVFVFFHAEAFKLFTASVM